MSFGADPAVVRLNISRFRDLLKQPELSAETRSIIERLLAEANLLLAKEGMRKKE